MKGYLRKDLILVYIKKFGLSKTLKKWGIALFTWRNIEKRWGLEKIKNLKTPYNMVKISSPASGETHNDKTVHFPSEECQRCELAIEYRGY